MEKYHLDYLARACNLAFNAKVATRPNPKVGCIITRGKQIIAEGWHQEAGGDHAEIDALKKINFQAQNCDVYVSLEPCSHTGKTPPCADALINAKVKRVFIAAADPNPLVAGRGIQKLLAAGTQVHTNLLPHLTQEANKGFFKRMQYKMPYITCKMASSLDGRTADISGNSKWITNKLSRQDVQMLRAESCAIITGIATVLADNPQLNIRDTNALKYIQHNNQYMHPTNIILDTKLSIPLEAQILKNTRVIIATTQPNNPQELQLFKQKKQQLADLGVTLYVQDYHAKEIDLTALLQHLSNLSFNEILLESGPTLAGKFIEQNLLDKLIVYLAPKVMGSLSKPLLNLPLKSMQQQINFNLTDITKLDEDIKITYLAKN